MSMDKKKKPRNLFHLSFTALPSVSVVELMSSHRHGSFQCFPIGEHM